MVAVALDIAFPVAHEPCLGICVQHFGLHLIKIVTDSFQLGDSCCLLSCRCLVILFKGKNQLGREIKEVVGNIVYFECITVPQGMAHGVIQGQEGL